MYVTSIPAAFASIFADEIEPKSAFEKSEIITIASSLSLPLPSSIMLFASIIASPMFAVVAPGWMRCNTEIASDLLPESSARIGTFFARMMLVFPLTNFSAAALARSNLLGSSACIDADASRMITV